MPAAESAEKLVYSMAELCDVLNISIWSVRGLVERGELRTVRAGERILIPADALKDYLAGRKPARRVRSS